MKKTIKSNVIDIEKNNQKRSLGKITLYENQNELENLSQSELFIYENQKSDLKNQKAITLEKFAKELVFFDLLVKENKVNKKILGFDIQKKKEKLCKMFIDEFYFVNTPNEKNYEKILIEKINNKFIIDYIKNSYNSNDLIDIENIEKTIKSIEELKEEYRKIGFENIENKEKQKEIVKDFRKAYQKEIQKQLKARYRLGKKYKFLIE